LSLRIKTSIGYRLLPGFPLGGLGPSLLAAPCRRGRAGLSASRGRLRDTTAGRSLGRL